MITSLSLDQSQSLFYQLDISLETYGLCSFSLLSAALFRQGEVALNFWTPQKVSVGKSSSI